MTAIETNYLAIYIKHATIEGILFSKRATFVQSLQGRREYLFTYSYLFNNMQFLKKVIYLCPRQVI